jgi:hypothetical protein
MGDGTVPHGAASPNGLHCGAWGTVSPKARVALRGLALNGSALTLSLMGIPLATPLKMHAPVGRVGIDSSASLSM